MRSMDEARDRASGLAAAWWLFLIAGAVSLAAGVILIAKPSNSLAVLAVVFGIFLLVDGIVELLMSFGSHTENRALAAILGVLGIVIGIVLIRHPFHGVEAIGILIGIWLVAAGVIRLVRTIALGGHVLLSVLIALLEIVVGIVIVSEPHIGYSTLAIIGGIWLVLNGFGAIALAFVVRKAAHESEAQRAAGAATAG